MTAQSFRRGAPTLRDTAHQATVTPATSPAEARSRLPLLTLVTLIALLTPAYFSVGPLVLTPSKTLFLVTVPVLMANLFRGQYGRVNMVDILIFAYIFWMGLALLTNHSVGRVIEYMGSVSLTLLGGYLTGRATIRSRETFIAVIRFLAMVVVLSLPFAIYESWTSYTTIPRWLATISGVTSHSDVHHPPRLGLYRTQFVFAHPIHYGLFCALTFSLVFVGLTGIWGWLRRYFVSAIILICVVLSVSSGPILTTGTAIGLILWGQMMKWTGRRWQILGWIVGIGYMVAEVASNRVAIYAIVERLALSPGTAFFRRLQFEFGVRQIERTPVFGVGFHGFPLPWWFNTTSIDNFWLLLALQFGLPALLLAAGAFIAAMIMVGRNDFSGRPDLQPLRLGWMVSMIAVSLALATVALWGEMYSIILFLLGGGMWMAAVDTSVPVAVTPEPGTEPPTARVRYTRFPQNNPRSVGQRLYSRGPAVPRKSQEK